MTTATPTHAPTPTGETSDSRSKGLKILLSVAVILAATSAATIVSLALFTDTATVGGNVFETGTIDISAALASTTIGMPGMAPGDQVTAPLTVTNLGSLELRYAVESTTDEAILGSPLTSRAIAVPANG